MRDLCDLFSCPDLDAYDSDDVDVPTDTDRARLARLLNTESED